MKQPIKMTPGDELHLTALMAPYSLNLVVGQDRQHLLGYGRAAFEAGKESAGQCLHQIQEPAPVHDSDCATHNAPTYPAGACDCSVNAAPAAVAVPAQVLTGEARAEAIKRLAPIRAKLVAAAVAVPDERAAFERELIDNHHYVPSDFSFKDGFYNGDDDYIQFGWDVWQARAALAATPAAGELATLQAGLQAAAPVVLPEPVAWRHSRTHDLHDAENEVQLADADAHAEPLFTEQQVRALLAGVSAPAAVAVEQAPVLYVSKGQLSNHRDPDGPDSANAGRYLPARITPAGNFTMPLFAAPQAQADARDAEIERAVLAERERICAAIKAEDDHCVTQGDYMLDSDDCIKVARGEWVRPVYDAAIAAAKGE